MGAEAGDSPRQSDAPAVPVTGEHVLIRVLVAPDCPHGDPTVELVRDVAARLAPEATVEIDDRAAPDTDGFRGSPTVIVAGRDLEHPDSPPPVNGCRIYPAGLVEPASGTPPRWLVEAAILRALEPSHILFLCVANSARSQMAEGLGRAMAGPGVRVSSAGSAPSVVRPQAVAALKEVGIDLSGHHSKGIAEADDGGVDTVITLCAEEVCPAYLGRARRVHWGLPDPAGAGSSPEEEMAAFREVRNELAVRLARLFGVAPLHDAVIDDRQRPGDPGHGAVPPDQRV